ncbi:60S RIBOSOMAL PROTEIN L36 [Salix viminalis]|uniref:60S RIBOSOMAL PROTEIN L36 n=1 Tax=Salix viminalis TaxID=40686 RepID=A0A9Q0SBC1_SALVM|nr:60S RIBOSOMAL PROTEIN L36 [Salix viminalis]
MFLRVSDSRQEGWPLGLHPLNVRVGIARNGDFSGSISLNTLLTGSPTSSTDSSSDLDTESTGSFFHDKSISLGSLIGVSNLLELSRKSTRTRKVEVVEEKKSCKSKTWIFSLCSRDTTDAKVVNETPSLGHFLAVERRASSEYRRNHSPIVYGPHDELELAQPVAEPNSLFVNGHVAPPRPGQSCSAEAERRGNEEEEQCGEYAVPVLFSCMCGQPSL